MIINASVSIWSYADENSQHEKEYQIHPELGITTEEVERLSQSFNFDVGKLSCSEFQDLYEKETTGFLDTVGGYFLPGFPQYMRGETLKGVLYTGSWVASLRYIYSRASVKGLGSYTRLLVTMLTGVAISSLSIYDARISNRFNDESFYNTNYNSIPNLLVAPFNFELIKDPNVYLKYPILAGLNIGLTILISKVFGGFFIAKENGRRIGEFFEKISQGSKTNLGKIVRLFLMSVTASYSAAVGEEMLFRGSLMPMFEEYLLRSRLVSSEDIAKNPCANLTVPSLMRKLEKLPKEDQVAIRNTAKQFANFIQAFGFAGAHGNFLSITHLNSGLIKGGLFSDTENGYELDKAVFTHYWYDFILFNILIMQLMK